MSGIIKIGIAGRMRTGKTTVARYLETRYDFHVAAFADPIKEFARSVGWNDKKDERGRRLLQDVGTVVRNYDEKFWIRKMLSCLPAGKSIAVDDMRMLLEHVELNAAGFKTILVLRDPSKILDAPASTVNHVTEREVDQIKPWRTVVNNGTYEELYAQVDQIIREYANPVSRELEQENIARMVN